MPSRPCRGLVLVRRKMRTDVCSSDVPRKVEIDRTVMSGIATDDDEESNRSSIEIAHEIAKRVDMRSRRGDRIAVVDRASDCSKTRVDLMRERMHDRRLPVAGDDDSSATMRDEIARDDVDPTICLLRRDPGDSRRECARMTHDVG